jgi:hypothetical protein
VNPGFHLHHAQFLGGGGPWIRPYLGLPQLKWLNLMAEERPQGVNPGQSLPPQLLKVLMWGLYHVEVLPDHALSPEGLGNGVATGKCGDQGEIIIL